MTRRQWRAFAQFLVLATYAAASERVRVDRWMEC